MTNSKQTPGPILFIILISVILSIVGCNSTNQPTPETNEVRIGIIAYLSGEQAEPSGIPTKVGAELATQLINEAGGIDLGDRQIHVTLVIEDVGDGYPEQVVAAARKLINQQNVSVIVGPQYSRDAIPVSEIAEETKIPMISPMSTNPQTTADKEYAFRVGFIDPFQGKVMAQFAKEEFGATKVAVLYDVASAYNKGIAEIFKDIFESQGGEVVAFETYTTDETNFSQQIANIKASEPDLIFLPNYSYEVPNQLQQIRDSGLTLPVIGSDAWGGIDPAIHNDLFDDTFYSTHWHPLVETPASQTFTDAYQKSYPDGPDILNTTALTYDALQLIFKAIEIEGDISPQAIRDGLATIKNHEGVSGIISYEGTGDPQKSTVIIQIKNGMQTFYKSVSP